MAQKLKKYEQSRVAVDAVILTFQEGNLYLYLNEREREPFPGMYELPGGLLLPGETAEATLLRKVGETISDFESADTRQFFTFTEPGRDPRVRTVSIGYVALVHINAGDFDATKWYPLDQSREYAFDHGYIVERALEFLTQQNVTTFKSLLPEFFRLNDLHALAEIIYSRPIDNRNFRRKVVKPGIVVVTEQVERGVAHRPARLYRFSDETEVVPSGS